jgi:hypothetical protein
MGIRLIRPKVTRQLARTIRYENQAFAPEDYALALQRLARWYVDRSCKLRAKGSSIKQLREATHI